MTRHTPEFLRARSSNLSLRSVVLEQSVTNKASDFIVDSQMDAKDLKPEAFTKPYLDFMTENPTVFHAVDYFKQKLLKAGYAEVSQQPPAQPKTKPKHSHAMFPHLVADLEP